MANYVTLEEIMEIYSLTHKTADEIVKRYCSDKYKDDCGIHVKFSEFHTIYTSKFNPPLFWESKESNILLEAFSKPINCKENLRRLRMIAIK